MKGFIVCPQHSYLLALFVVSSNLTIPIIKMEGNKLNEKILREKESIQNCKSGVLDFKDVKSYLKTIKKYIEEDFVYYGDSEQEQIESKEDLIWFIETNLGEKI